MKNLLITLSLCLLATVGFSQKEFEDLDEVRIYYRGLFEENKTLPDELGNIIIDTGAGRTGRVQMRITDVSITKEDRPAEPGCTEMCPPRTIITFTCNKAPCVTDPTFEDHVSETGTIQINSHKRGKKVYDFLIGYQKYILGN